MCLIWSFLRSPTSTNNQSCGRKKNARRKEFQECPTHPTLLVAAVAKDLEDQQPSNEKTPCVLRGFFDEQCWETQRSGCQRPHHHQMDRFLYLVTLRFTMLLESQGSMRSNAKISACEHVHGCVCPKSEYGRDPSSSCKNTCIGKPLHSCNWHCASSHSDHIFKKHTPVSRYCNSLVELFKPSKGNACK